MLSFYEFFAGGGMARLGLGDRWTCTFANDLDPTKLRCYRTNFASPDVTEGDIANLTVASLKGHANLAWASFPCQDLSLAGSGKGLSGTRSGTFWPFVDLLKALSARRRAPHIVVLENVCGAITSNSGRDFATIGRELVNLGYRFGALVIDAVHFVPQSRPRLFIVAVGKQATVPQKAVRPDPSVTWHPRSLVEAKFRLPKPVQDKWIWFDLPQPKPRKVVFADLVDREHLGLTWHSAAETSRLLSMMSPINRAKVEQAQLQGGFRVGALYRRTRNGVQRAEVRFDDVAGCLRTPLGGSSRQTIVVIDHGAVRTRLISTREAARLMGLPDTYVLPPKYNDAYHLAGDGLVVPVVSYLSEHVLLPIAAAVTKGQRKTA